MGRLRMFSTGLSGSATTITSTNTAIEDKLIELGHGTTGSPSGDAGIIVERGSAADNAGIVWDESDDRWWLCVTTATGTSSGDLTLSDAVVRCGALSVYNASGSSVSGVTVTQSDVSQWAYRGSGERLGLHVDVLRTNDVDVIARFGDSTTIDIMEIKGGTSGTSIRGPLTIHQGSAPASTTDKLYNVGGTLTFNGTALGAGGGSADSDVSTAIAVSIWMN